MRGYRFILLLLICILLPTSHASAQNTQKEEVKADTAKVISKNKATPRKSGGFGDGDQNNPSTGEGSGGGFGDSDQSNPTTEGSSGDGFNDSDMGGGVPLGDEDYITFADAVVKDICVANWDANGDGELTEAEAAAVTSLGDVFSQNDDIVSFNELRYFTGLTEIPRGCFYKCTNLASVVIPDNITRIGYSAFDDCYALASINLPSTITFIDGAAFSDCHNLTSITLPEGIPSIGEWFFDNCTGLTEIVIPSSVTSIGSWAFSGCSGLTSINIPEGVTSIGGSAFRNCNCLISINIPEGVTSIGSSAFYGCSGLTSVTIPSSVTSIDSYAFSGCSGLTSVTIPSSVTSIGDYAFSGCSGLTSVTIPSSVTSIRVSAFNNCSGLTSIIVESGNAVYDSRDNCNAIIKTSTNELIVGCQNTFIPESVTSIGSSAFSGCSGLTSVTIPESVTSIASYAFQNCSSLTSVTVNWNTPLTITSDVFSNRTNATLYVPYGSKVAYEAADYWAEFGEIVEMEPQDTELQKLAFSVSATADNNYKTVSTGALDMVAIHALLGTEEPVVYSLASDGTKTKEYNLTPNPGFWCDVEGKVCSHDNDACRIGYAFVDDHLEVYQKPGWVQDLGGDYVLYMYLVNEETGNYVTVETSVHVNPVSIANPTVVLTTTSSATIPLESEQVQVFPNHALETINMVDVYEAIGTESPVVYAMYPDGYLKKRYNLNPHPGFWFNTEGKVCGFAFYTGEAYIGYAFVDDHLEIYQNPGQTQTGDTYTLDIFFVNEETKVCAKHSTTITIVPKEADIAEGIYFLKNVETGKYLNKGNEYGTHSVLADEPLPARISKQSDGSYTIFFPIGSSHQQLLFRANSDGVYVDYQGQSDGSPFWTITEASDGNYHIQTLITHELYGQDVMPNTYLGNNPNKEAHNQNGEALGVYNDVDGNVSNAEGMNITWQLVPEGLHTEAQAERLEELIGQAVRLNIDTNSAQAVLDNETSTYTEMQVAIQTLENQVEVEQKKFNLLRHELNSLIISAEVISVNTDEARTVAENTEATYSEFSQAVSTLRSAYISKLGEGVNPGLLPLDVTSAIINPTFTADNASGWEGDTPQFQSHNNAEFYQKAFDFHQTINGLPDGKYVLKVKGLHRPGSNQDVYASYMQGMDNASAELYANEAVKTLVNHATGAQNTRLIDDNTHWYEVSYNDETQYVPNSMYGARSAFDAGLYDNELPVTVTNGTITIGIRLSESVDYGWVIFDEFQLEYLGPKNMLYVENAPSIPTGGKTTLEISLKNDDAVNMTDFYLQLPEGMEVEKISVSADRSNKHQVSAQKNDDGYYHVVCYSSQNNAFKGNDGVLYNIVLSCDKTVTPGNYEAGVKNVLMTGNITQPDFTFGIEVSDILMGDANGDGNINGLDIVEVVDYIMHRPSEDFHFVAADLHYDSKINGLDLVELVSLVLEQGYTPGASSAPTLNGSKLHADGMLLQGDRDGLVTLGTESADGFILAQCIVQLSEGMELKEVKTDVNHTAAWQQIDDSRYAVVTYSMKNAAFGTNETLLEFDFTGKGSISVEDFMLVDKERQARYLGNSSLDTATGIGEMERMGNGENEKWYDLAGRRVSSSQSKGVYIVNGKKVFVK